MAEIPNFEIIRSTVLMVQVCTSLTDLDEIRDRSEQEIPCGTKYGWVYADVEQGVVCESRPTTHKHYLFRC